MGMAKKAPSVGPTNLPGAGGGIVDQELLEATRAKLTGFSDKAGGIANLIRSGELGHSAEVREAVDRGLLDAIGGRSAGIDRLRNIGPVDTSFPKLDVANTFSPSFEMANERFNAAKEQAAENLPKGGRRQAIEAIIGTERAKAITQARLSQDAAEGQAVYQQKVGQIELDKFNANLMRSVGAAMVGIPVADIASVGSNADQFALSGLTFEAGSDLQIAQTLASLFSGSLQAQTNVDIAQGQMDMQTGISNAQSTSQNQAKKTDAMMGAAAIAAIAAGGPAVLDPSAMGDPSGAWNVVYA